MPFVSVIVPVYNDEERIGDCINSLLCQTYPKDRYEIIVVDNGSTDGTLKSVSNYQGIKILSENNIQSSYAARNMGIGHAKGEIIAFTDADCIAMEDWIEKGVSVMVKNPGCGLAGGRITLFFKDPDRPTAAELYESVTNFRQREDIEIYKFASTANAFTYKKIFDKTGLFNEKLKSGGDNEWGRRVHMFGYSQLYMHETCVFHPARHTLAQLRSRMVRLVGGNYDQRKNDFQIIKKWSHSIRDAVSLMVRGILGLRPADGLRGLVPRSKFVYACFFIELVRISERARLIAGGKAQR